MALLRSLDVLSRIRTYFHSWFFNYKQSGSGGSGSGSLIRGKKGVDPVHIFSKWD
jgi:hypothetical protein